MAVRLDPEPWFVRELECIFSHGGNSFRMRWDHRSGRWALEEKALGRWYHIMWIYPFEQHSGTLRLLRRSNVRNPQHELDFRQGIAKVEMEREARSRRLSEWSGEVMAEISRASSLPKIAQGQKSWHHEASYAEGLRKAIERGDNPEPD